MKIKLFEYLTIRPLELFGINFPYISINLDTILLTWTAMLILFLLILFTKKFLLKPLNPMTLMLEQSIEVFTNLCIESFGYFKYNYFSFVTALFYFTLACNLITLLPFLEEPTRDLHTTFALAFISFLYVQYQKIKSHGLGKYLKEFIEPIFIMLPLNIIGEFAKVISMSFRLFGNIMGGSIVMYIALQAFEPYRGAFIIFSIVTLALYLAAKKYLDLSKYVILKNIFNIALIFVFLLPLMNMFFGIFEGFIQAFVITMLTITYLAVGTSDTMSDDDQGEII